MRIGPYPERALPSLQETVTTDDAIRASSRDESSVLDRGNVALKKSRRPPVHLPLRDLLTEGERGDFVYGFSSFGSRRHDLIKILWSHYKGTALFIGWVWYLYQGTKAFYLPGTKSHRYPRVAVGMPLSSMDPPQGPNYEVPGALLHQRVHLLFLRLLVVTRMRSGVVEGHGRVSSRPVPEFQ